MAIKRPVILCGKSILMGGMALNLENDENLEVIQVFDVADIANMMKTIRPVAILVDSAAERQLWVNAINQEVSDIPIIALNPENKKIYIYSCQQEQAETLQELKGVILQRQCL